MIYSRLTRKVSEELPSTPSVTLPRQSVHKMSSTLYSTISRSKRDRTESVPQSLSPSWLKHADPFTVLPALMNEYRVPELNVQNGVLKSLSFMFEYIGEMAKDYIYTITPLLEDALTDRDLVHRQTAASAVKHLGIGVAGLGCEDALVHLLNHIWPNVFETSPHVINAVMEAIEAMRIGLGPGNILLYTLQGLFHPARRVRLFVYTVVLIDF